MKKEFLHAGYFEMTPILSGVNLNIRCMNLYQNRREISNKYLYPTEWPDNLIKSQEKSSAFSSAEMFKNPLWQTVWTQISLLL